MTGICAVLPPRHCGSKADPGTRLFPVHLWLRRFTRHFHDCHGAARRLHDSMYPQRRIHSREQGRPLLQFTLFAIKSLPHSQVADPQDCLLGYRDGSRQRKDCVHDDEACAWLERVDQMFQNVDCLGEGPIVEDHAQEIDICVLDGLGSKEILTLETYPPGDGIGQAVEAGLRCSDGVWEIFDNELQLWICGGERNACMTARASNLYVTRERRFSRGSCRNVRQQLSHLSARPSQSRVLGVSCWLRS
jgi:hypothetical protein